jgi:LmeA-like phospholipid-binding
VDGAVRRLATATLVILIALGIVLGVVDRVSAHYAEQQIAQQVTTQLAAREITSAPPEVTITGFPFLTQVARGNYEEVRLNLRDLRGGMIPLPLLEVHAYDVRASLNGLRDGTEKPVATRMTGVGTLSYGSLVEAAGLTGVTLSGDGKLLRLNGNLPVAGEMRGAAKVTVVDGKVRIEVTELTAANLTPAAQALVDMYKSKLARTFSLPALPFSLKLQGVNPASSGLQISASATEVVLG